jgi:hypothetical protein
VYAPIEYPNTRRNLIEEDFSILLVFPVGGATSGVYTYLLIVQAFIKQETCN